MTPPKKTGEEALWSSGHRSWKSSPPNMAGIPGIKRLAKELQCDPMSLYCYAHNRAALLDGVTELVFNELNLVSEEPDWQGQLRRIARDVRAMGLRPRECCIRWSSCWCC